MKRILMVVVTMAVFMSAMAQMPQKLPLDPKVRTGVLENGLTYFVVQNAEPKGQAEFYIAQKVGSILEDDNQRGLAHFLEHMAFNGSKNFPGNGIISYLEKIGVKFGANLNAGTSFDQTIYNISSVPVKRQGIIDSCLMILHDWSCAISLTTEDIEKERGVIREEFRTSSSAMLRMIEKIMPEIMPGSRYAYRLPIGTLNVINNFTPQEIRDYYNKWYRPDLQGIIVVGDIDAAAVEAQIKTMFGSIPKPVNPAPRIELPVPDTKDALISVATDPEASTTSLQVMYKHDVLPKEIRATAASIVMDYMNSMVTGMLNSRFQDLGQKPDAPFTYAQASYGNFCFGITQTKDAFTLGAGVKEGKMNETLKALINEAEKVRRFGFTPSEYDRAKANYMSRLEQIYKEKEKQKNSFYVNQIVDHFITNNAYAGIETEYALMQQVAPAITVEQINEYAKSLPVDQNLAIAVMMPKKEGLKVPSNEELMTVYQNALKEQVEPYKETLSKEPLVPVAPKAGKVVSEVKEPMSGATVWNMSNGATVVVMKTDFKDDQIMFSATSKGGYSLLDKSDIVATKVINDVAAIGGLGNFSATDLKKVLAGKNVSVRSNIGMMSEGLSGSSTPKDIETFMQLVYLSFTSIRQDNEAFQSYLGKMKAQLENMAAQPMVAFSDTVQKVLYNSNPYAKRLDLDMLAKVNYEKTLQLARARFENAADFTFIFVGNVDPAVLKPLAETYIGSLPANKTKKENWKNTDMIPVKGKVVNHFDKDMQTPKATVYTFFSGKVPYTLENVILASMTKQVFDMVFTRTIREEEGGTYGVGVAMNMTYFPQEYFTFMFGFDTDVALKERLLKRAHLEINNVIEKGVSPADFSKIIEYMQKTNTQNLRENSYWLGAISNRYLIGKDMHTEMDAILKSLTKEKLQKFIKETLSQGNQVEVIMSGKAPVAK
ncbi:MAG: insulinase family protein [Bacteroidales bacterium]|nr:insulinase family protein [Bacteroidales bacterium]